MKRSRKMWEWIFPGNVVLPSSYTALEHGVTPRGLQAMEHHDDSAVQIAKSTHAVPARQKTLQAALEAVVYGFGIYAIVQLAGMAVPRLTGNELAWVIGSCATAIGGLIGVPRAIKAWKQSKELA